ncbi:hypothetical protein Vadar_026162 [Vaccinium darrowii]|uniref:Uncharacterized protein n=1 Tax=Vaccinium darrowii TaxID=229202 RepID=A0ACB7ZEU8_9ERIC|nr:hypothetical protein Vadar_026162 [Vaccinium darrowii]
MSTTTKLSKDLDGASVDQSLYHNMIGSLLYLTASRPDIAFSVGVCARYQANPKESHLTAVKRVIINSWTQQPQQQLDAARLLDGESSTLQQISVEVLFAGVDWGGVRRNRLGWGLVYLGFVCRNRLGFCSTQQQIDWGSLEIGVAGVGVGGRWGSLEIGIEKKTKLLYRPLAFTATSPNFKPLFNASSASHPSLLNQTVVSSYPPLPYLSLIQVRHRTKKEKREKTKKFKPWTPVKSKMKKTKMKCYSSYKGRFRVLNDGTIRRWKEGKRHNAHLKSKAAKQAQLLWLSPFFEFADQIQKNIILQQEPHNQ